MPVWQETGVRREALRQGVLINRYFVAAVEISDGKNLSR